jgi:hypothetical protein
VGGRAATCCEQDLIGAMWPAVGPVGSMLDPAYDLSATVAAMRQSGCEPRANDGPKYGLAIPPSLKP